MNKNQMKIGTLIIGYKMKVRIEMYWLKMKPVNICFLFAYVSRINHVTVYYVCIGFSNNYCRRQSDSKTEKKIETLAGSYRVARTGTEVLRVSQIMQILFCGSSCLE